MEIPRDTTVRSLVERVIPAMHARLATDEGSADHVVISVCVAGEGGWTVTLRGREMRVAEGESERPAFWLYTTARTVERFLEDATGPQRFVPKFEPVGPNAPAVLSDYRIVRRVALAEGRVELALRDDDDERFAIVFGFGRAARRAIDPDDADVVIETGTATLERVLAGALAPEDALADGDVRVRGNRFLALQLALALGPFYPARIR